MSIELHVGLRVKNTSEAIAFYVRAFGAVEKYRLTEPSGRVGHAEFTVQNQLIMISDEYPEYNLVGPKTLGGCPVTLSLTVGKDDDVRAIFHRALDAGAKQVFPMKEQFYGALSGRVEDPFGYQWIIQKEMEHLTPEQMQQRYDAMMAK